MYVLYSTVRPDIINLECTGLQELCYSWPLFELHLRRSVHVVQ